jgi:2-dehydro-3-deoxygluconokinase
MYDVVTLGETMLRLTPPDFRLMEQATTLTMHVAGSESNVAAGLARLGLRVCWFSRLTDNIVGRYLVNGIAAQGVDTSKVIWTDEDRVGTYFVEEGRPPRSSTVLYDRRYSAMSRIQPSDLPADLFAPDAARLLHISGITPALSESAAATVRHAVKLAKAAGWELSFDLNYRAKLWSEAEARTCYEEYMPQSDIIITPLGDAQRIFDIHENATTVLNTLNSTYPQATIIITLGAEGAVACKPPTGYHLHQPAFPAEQVDRIGGGDAFDAGFLYSYLQGDTLSTALRWGTAVAALKYSIPGDMPLVRHDDVLGLVESGGSSVTIVR